MGPVVAVGEREEADQRRDHEHQRGRHVGRPPQNAESAWQAKGCRCGRSRADWVTPTVGRLWTTTFRGEPRARVRATPSRYCRNCRSGSHPRARRATLDAYWPSSTNGSQDTGLAGTSGTAVAEATAARALQLLLDPPAAGPTPPRDELTHPAHCAVSPSAPRCVSVATTATSARSSRPFSARSTANAAGSPVAPVPPTFTPITSCGGATAADRFGQPQSLLGLPSHAEHRDSAANCSNSSRLVQTARERGN